MSEVDNCCYRKCTHVATHRLTWSGESDSERFSGQMLYCEEHIWHAENAVILAGLVAGTICPSNVESVRILGKEEIPA